MIQLDNEKKRTLSTQDVYDIISFSVQAADDEGFMNSFIFTRAMYCFAALRLYTERVDELQGIIAKNINSAWDYLLEDGTVEKMTEEHSEDLEYLAEAGSAWFTEFEEYAHSARGLLNTIQVFTSDIVAAAADQFKAVAQETGVQEALTIADKWGMNNNPQGEEEQEEDPEALFTE